MVSSLLELSSKWQTWHSTPQTWLCAVLLKATDFAWGKMWHSLDSIRSRFLYKRPQQILVCDCRKLTVRAQTKNRDARSFKSLPKISCTSSLAAAMVPNTCCPRALEKSVPSASAPTCQLCQNFEQKAEFCSQHIPSAALAMRIAWQPEGCWCTTEGLDLVIFCMLKIWYQASAGKADGTRGFATNCSAQSPDLNSVVSGVYPHSS